VVNVVSHLKLNLYINFEQTYYLHGYLVALCIVLRFG